MTAQSWGAESHRGQCQSVKNAHLKCCNQPHSSTTNTRRNGEMGYREPFEAAEKVKVRIITNAVHQWTAKSKSWVSVANV